MNMEPNESENGMFLRVAFAPCEIDSYPDNFFDVAVVIDVLRATTTLLFALNAGAQKIIPAATIDEAKELAQKHNGSMLCGERNGIKIPGFDLGNSPSEYTAEKVEGRILIFASTNGSVMVKKARRIAEKLLLTSLRNLNATAKKIMDIEPRKMLIACSGQKGFLSLEDAYCAGILIDIIDEHKESMHGDDAALVSHLLSRYFGYDTDKIFGESMHARYLGSELDLWDDLDDAAEIDADDIVPIYENGEIHL